VAADELYQQSREAGAAPDSGSHAYVGPGLRLDWKPLSLLVEGRLRRYDEAEIGGVATRPDRERRALLVLGLWHERSMLGLPRTRAFNEVYSETVYTSADDDNVAHSTYVRPGLRYEPWTRTYLDAFAKPYLAVDRARHDYGNRAELEAGGRVTKAVGWLSFSLSTTYLVSKTFAYAADPETRSRSSQGYRVLAVIGGAT
jgi:hypothetical protein